jgi:hypothetical protein
LGDGTFAAYRTAPVQVSGLTGVVTIAGGFIHSLATRSDHTAWAWGYNGSGPLGDGTTTDRRTPVQVSSLTGASAVAAGNGYSLFAVPVGRGADLDWDGDVDLADYTLLAWCLTQSGPNKPLNPGHMCLATYHADLDADSDIDLGDFALFSACFNDSGTSPAPGCPL